MRGYTAKSKSRRSKVNMKKLKEISKDLPVINQGKCCIQCSNFILSVGQPGYGEYTPGSDFDMICIKGIWEYTRYFTQEHYCNCIMAAERCPKFEERKNTR